MDQLIQKVGINLVRKRFNSGNDLNSGVYASLVNYLKEKEIIRTGPFDASLNETASLEDLDQDKLKEFVHVARAKRGFPLPAESATETILTHLNLVNNGRVSNAALLLFGKQPQRFFITSEVKCAHFHGFDVVKPIPAYQVYKGDVFQLVNQAVDFVMGKINVSVGTRDESTQVAIDYELPLAAVSEAIVNAVAHRDYTSNGSVQVMLFKDRLEVWNPGQLPLSLSPAKLRQPHNSIPANPLLAEPMYLAGYIERLGTGTGDIIRLCKEKGLKEPEFIQEENFKSIIWRTLKTSGEATGQATGQVTGQVTGQATGQVEESIRRVLLVIFDEMKSSEIQSALQLKHREYFRDNYLNPAMDQGFVDMVSQEKPNSPNQKYRLTSKGIAFRNRLLNPQSIPKPADEEIKKSISGEATIHEPTHVTDHVTDHVTAHVTDHVTDHVEDHVKRLLLVVKDEISRQAIMERLELKNRSNFMQKYLKPALDTEYIEMTIPDKPRSVNQKYRLTPKGIAIKQQLKNNK